MSAFTTRSPAFPLSVLAISSSINSWSITDVFMSAPSDICNIPVEIKTEPPEAGPKVAASMPEERLGDGA